eukprot:3031781-Amphidinium_carterae.1
MQDNALRIVIYIQSLTRRLSQTEPNQIFLSVSTGETLRNVPLPKCLGLRLSFAALGLQGKFKTRSVRGSIGVRAGTGFSIPLTQAAKCYLCDVTETSLGL